MAHRVAKSSAKPGRVVGYQHHFEKLSRDSVIRFTTDGILLAERRATKLFRAYDTLIIDEAPELAEHQTSCSAFSSVCSRPATSN